MIREPLPAMFPVAPLLCALVLALLPCGAPAQYGTTPGAPPGIDPADFMSVIDHEFLPLVAGRKFLYEGPAGDAIERVEVIVTGEVKSILGVPCTIVRDRVYRNGELIEDTDDWFAQDNKGNVWYFGEISRTIKKGETVHTNGSWEAGVGGAMPGILMPGQLLIGETYRQEEAPGEAEDMVRIVSLDAAITTAYGTFAHCLQTEEWNPLEPGVVEWKYYAAGVGLIAERVKGRDDGLELIAVIHE